MNSALKILTSRNIVGQTSTICQSKGVYAGFDPTADSLHLGHLGLLTSLFRFNICGHKIVALVPNTEK